MAFQFHFFVPFFFWVLLIVYGYGSMYNNHIEKLRDKFGF